MEIRPATPDDAEAFAGVLAAVAEERRWILTEPPVDVAARAARLRAEIESGETRAFLAEEDGRLAGVLGLHRTQVEGVLTLGISVLAQQRGRGAGRALLEAGLAAARQGGAHKIELDVFPWNGAAIALYVRAGFEVEGVRRRHYPRSDGSLADAVLMALLLDGGR